MLIIDPKTGKRLVQAEVHAQSKNPTKETLKRSIEKGLEESENSPMDPPDALSEEHTLKNKNEKFEPLLQLFADEHQAALEKIQLFENAVTEFKNLDYKYSEKINRTFGEFFEFFDQKLLIHNAKEEKSLFPLLHQRLIESGEHSGEAKPVTGVDIMEDDHVKFIQLGALTFNLLGLATRLPDETSRMIVNDVAYHNARELIEILRLHIFREDNTLFPLAQSLISPEEFESLESKILGM
jgi:hemerythrin-like domain-containing protein